MRLIMKYYLAILLFIFMGCAAQMAPKGGPIDNQGPSLIDVSHSEDYKIANTNEQIIFYFNEFLNPLTIVNAIEIINFTDFNYQIVHKYLRHSQLIESMKMTCCVQNLFLRDLIYILHLKEF